MARYEIRVAHEFDEALAAAFDGLDATGVQGITVISGDFDQAALHGLLERIRNLDLELIDARRVRPTSPEPSGERTVDHSDSLPPERGRQPSG